MAEVTFDSGRLWRGAAASALVAAGVALVGLLIIRGLLDIKVVRRTDGEDFVQATTGWYVAAAIVATILATALLHVLFLLVPAPFRFFGWISALMVTAAVIVPLTLDAGQDTRIATALLNLAIGATVASLVSGIGHTAVVRGRYGP
jgi:Family of unknown function (DUF6069)